MNDLIQLAQWQAPRDALPANVVFREDDFESEDFEDLERAVGNRELFELWRIEMNSQFIHLKMDLALHGHIIEFILENMRKNIIRVLGDETENLMQHLEGILDNADPPAELLMLRIDRKAQILDVLVLP